MAVERHIGFGIEVGCDVSSRLGTCAGDVEGTERENDRNGQGTVT